MDRQIGRLLQALSGSGRTTVIFVGDNGTPGAAYFGGASAQAKGTLYDGGVRVPMIIAGAGVRDTPRVVDDLVHMSDLFATILDIMGETSTVGPSSVSLAPYIDNTATESLRTHVFSRRHQQNGSGPYALHNEMARNDQYKLIRRRLPPPIASTTDELYDLLDDGDEQTNLLPLGMNSPLQPIYDELSALLTIAP